jgi:hypothetical protein
MTHAQIVDHLITAARSAHAPKVLAVCTVLAAAAAVRRYGEHRFAQGYITAMEYRCTNRPRH